MELASRAVPRWRRSWSGWVGWAVLVLIVATVVREAAVGAPASAAFGATIVAYPAVGVLILQRRPGHAIGWLLLMPGLSSLTVWADGLLAQPPSELTLLVWLAIWFENFSWLLLIFPVFLLPALFPTGRPLSPRWRWHTRVVLAMAALLLVLGSLAEAMGPLDGGWTIENPIGVWPSPDLVPGFMILWTLGLVGVTLGSLSSLVLRYRRAGAMERDQIKWLLYAVAVFAAVYIPLVVLNETSWDHPLIEVLLGGGLLFIPVAVGIAILRYRVFDIDVVIRRTVLYLLVALLLAGTYVASVFVLQRVIVEWAGLDSSLGVAGSTLVAVMAFSPVRRRVRHVVDRRFFRPSYDAEEVVSRFQRTVRDETDIEALADALIAAVDPALRPASAEVWINVPPPKRP